MLFKIGFCQFKPALLEKEKNIAKMCSLVDEIQADLIVFPELCTSGYVFCEKSEVQEFADDFESSKTTRLFTELSQKNNTAYVIGFPEKHDRKLYNSSMLINPDGTKHLYRKIHLFNEEKQWFAPGDLGFNVHQTKYGVLVGQMICFDWIFPEAARTLMLKGAQIIAHPANLVLPWCQKAMITRSLENRVYTITCNRTGTEVNQDKEFYFTGMSQVVSPLGEVLCDADKIEERVVVFEIDIESADDKQITKYNNILEDRIPEFYKY
ncbi:MAG: beta-ureidopropionase [Candidatus Cloacimonetes bacterium]|nr:beta-ureidopropionase [Candidatus Cloacimonadota bacterium]